MSVVDELSRALNRVSAENASNTPDFILAEFLAAQLAAFDSATRAREKWYGVHLSPGSQPFSNADRRAVVQGRLAEALSMYGGDYSGDAASQAAMVERLGDVVLGLVREGVLPAPEQARAEEVEADAQRMLVLEPAALIPGLVRSLGEAVMAEPHRGGHRARCIGRPYSDIYEWLYANGVNEWIPESPTFQTRGRPGAGGTLTYTSYVWEEDSKRGWNGQFIVKDSDKGVLTEPRTVPLLAEPSWLVRELCSLRLILDEQDPSWKDD